MDFSKNLLKKYGWKEGEGLGKNSDGISKPIRARFKFDSAGLGVDRASEFNNHWWERVFNEAANNLDVNRGEDSIQIAVKSDSVEISTKEYCVKKLKTEGKDEYKNFVKKSVLSGLRENHKEAGDIEPELEVTDIPKYKILSDGELFAACGGRTAHKGARHGLKLSGKLSRIEEQERELVRKMQEKMGNVEQDGWNLVSRKKKRKLEDKTESTSELQSILYTTEYHVKSKKKRKKEKQLDNYLSATISSVNIGGESTKDMTDSTPQLINNRKKNRNKGNLPQTYEGGETYLHESECTIPPTEEVGTMKKKKEKVSDGAGNYKQNENNFFKSSDSSVEQISKKKKKKLKRYAKSVAEQLESSLSLVCTA